MKVQAMIDYLGTSHREPDFEKVIGCGWVLARMRDYSHVKISRWRSEELKTTLLKSWQIMTKGFVTEL